VSVAALSWLLIRGQREQALQEAIHGSQNLAEIIHLSLDHEMRLNRREELRTTMRSVSELDIVAVRIYNKHGAIAYSSVGEEVGEVVDIGSDACVACHAGPVPVADLHPEDRSRIYTAADGSLLLGTIRVIRNEAACAGSGCHLPPDEQNVLGVLDVIADMEPHQARVADATRNAILFSLVAVGLITGILYFLIGRGVRQPIDAMIEATRRVATGGATLPVPRGASYEIGILAASFNELVEGLSSSRFQTEAWANTLANKVQETARDLREAQFQVAHAEKLSSVGLVAAGIAHELNSPLMAIITFTHLVRGALAADAPEQEDLQMIEREANRCAAIIRQLLDYSRKQSQQPDTEPCRLQDTLEDAADLLKIEAQNANVTLDLDVPEDLPEVDANPVQLMQVFVNLLLNAVQAMPDGGTITIRAEVVEREEHRNDALPPHRGTHLVKTTVEDTGTGIPADSLHKVFDPFFTTKAVGKGSGLGLSVSLGLVRGYRGTILADSDGHSGTRFTVLLPVPDESDASVPDASAERTEP
jgi:two-component system NtrC family sensor kinase